MLQAHLETVKWGKGFGILNVDDHSTVLKRSGRDFSTARPDILHQCLLMLLDSPLNRAGFLQVYIHTANNVLIEVNPQTRIPRTFPRFAGNTNAPLSTSLLIKSILILFVYVLAQKPDLVVLFYPKKRNLFSNKFIFSLLQLQEHLKKITSCYRSVK